MKLVSFILVVFFIVTCSTQKVSINENTKFLQVKYTFGEDTLDTINKSFTRVYKSTEIYRVDFSFTENEIERIIEVIYDEDFFTLPDSLPVLKPLIYFGNCGEEFLEVTLNDQKNLCFGTVAY